MSIQEFIENFKNNVNNSIENYIPRNIENINFEKHLVFNKKEIADKNAIQENIINPIYDLLDRGGKRWRPALMYICYKTVGGKDENLINKFLVVPEIIHSASLIHDDIEDRAKIRRTKECIHLIYGLDCAINTGSLMYFLPLKLIFDNKLNLDNHKILEIFKLYTDELNSIHLGQAADIFWHNKNNYDINYDQYLAMCSCKTGVLSRFSAKLGCILGTNNNIKKNALYNFAEKIGVAFQIQDDILDLKSNNEFNKIHGCQDIVEGKKTIIIIHTLNNCSLEEKNKLIEILNKKENTNQEIKNAKKIITKYNSIEFAENKAKEIVLESIEDINKHIEESKYKKLLLEFADYVTNRKI